MRADLQQPLVELCLLLFNEETSDETVEKAKTTRIWMEWPVFDVRISKFEVFQWVSVCGVHLRDWEGSEGVSNVGSVMKTIIEEETKEEEVPPRCAND